MKKKTHRKTNVEPEGAETFNLSLLLPDQIKQIEDAVLKQLSVFADERMNKWFAEQEKERAELRAFNDSHHKTVEGYLEYFKSISQPKVKP